MVTLVSLHICAHFDTITILVQDMVIVISWIIFMMRSIYVIKKKKMLLFVDMLLTNLELRKSHICRYAGN